MAINELFTIRKIKKLNKKRLSLKKDLEKIEKEIVELNQKLVKEGISPISLEDCK